MKYLLVILLLIPNISSAQEVDKIILELSFRSCLVGYYQSFIELSIKPSQEQLKYSREFCIEFSKSVLKKIKENK